MPARSIGRPLQDYVHGAPHQRHASGTKVDLNADSVARGAAYARLAAFAPVYHDDSIAVFTGKLVGAQSASSPSTALMAESMCSSKKRLSSAERMYRAGTGRRCCTWDLITLNGEDGTVVSSKPHGARKGSTYTVQMETRERENLWAVSHSE